MKKLLLSIVVLVSITACNAQNNDRTKIKTDGAIVHQVKPNVTSKVNRKYDEKGNLIGYDSVAVWSYSSDGKNHGDTDSMMSQLMKGCEKGFPKFGLRFGAAFPDDSVFYKDFVSPTFLDVGKLMRQMDSVRNSITPQQFQRSLPSYEN